MDDDDARAPLLGGYYRGGYDYAPANLGRARASAAQQPALVMACAHCLPVLIYE